MGNSEMSLYITNTDNLFHRAKNPPKNPLPITHSFYCRSELNVTVANLERAL